MKLLHYLVMIPLLVIAVAAVLTADPEGTGIPCTWYDEKLDTKTVLVIFLLYGYTAGRLGAWFGYSPLRSDLRRQKKANKVLNKEQEKLNETVSGLKQDIERAKAEQTVQPAAPEKKKSFWKNIFTHKTEGKAAKSDGEKNQ